MSESPGTPGGVQVTRRAVRTRTSTADDRSSADGRRRRRPSALSLVVPAFNESRVCLRTLTPFAVIWTPVR